MSVLPVRFWTRLLASGAALIIWAACASAAAAADVVLTPATGSYAAGATFAATVQVRPGSDSINAVEAALSFDPAALSVVSISKTGSVFTLWPVEPAFSNSDGTITFGGGHTAPITAPSTVVTVTFKAVAAGTGAVDFDSASVLAADGMGTDVLDNAVGASYTVTAAATPPPEATPEPSTTTETPTEEPEDENAAIAFGDPPRAPEVGSQVFLDPEVWYRVTEGIFTWELPFDVKEVAAELATSSDHDPQEVFDPPIEEFAVSKENLHDGIQYLSVKFKNQVGWGAVTNRQIKIDTTPPEPFTIDVRPSNSQTGFPLLTFAATDETSGIEKYEVTIADQEPFEITPEEAKVGYLLKDLEDGTYTVKVVAIDRAGNKTQSSAPVLITAGWVKQVETEQGSALWAFLTPANSFIIVLCLIILLQFGYLIYERRQASKREEKLRKETREIQDQMGKIFSALRDEIYDQIVSITKRPRLSKNERAAVEGLNQALEVSETLIEKEIDDVKKILK